MLHVGWVGVGVGVWVCGRWRRTRRRMRRIKAGRQAGKYAGKQACMHERTGKTEQQATGRDHCSHVVAAWF